MIASLFSLPWAPPHGLPPSLCSRRWFATTIRLQLLPSARPLVVQLIAGACVSAVSSAATKNEGRNRAR
jgi:hypothetical protein